MKKWKDLKEKLEADIERLKAELEGYKMVSKVYIDLNLQEPTFPLQIIALFITI